MWMRIMSLKNKMLEQHHREKKGASAAGGAQWRPEERRVAPAVGACTRSIAHAGCPNAS